MKLIFLGLVLTLITNTGCKKVPEFSGLGKADKDKAQSSDNKPGEAALGLCGLPNYSYKGFGDRPLGGERMAEEEISDLGDRARLKPYQALAAEYQRATGVVPDALARATATFAAAPDRWYIEPQASSVTLFVSYRIAYEASFKMIENDPQYNVAPSQETSSKACLDFATKAWNRIPADEEVAACVKLLMVDTASAQDNRARWAHGFSSILTASSFLSY